MQKRIEQIEQTLNKPEYSNKNNLKTNLAQIKSKLDKLVKENNPNLETIKQLEQEIKQISQELKLPEDPKPDSPKPDNPIPPQTLVEKIVADCENDLAQIKKLNQPVKIKWIIIREGCEDDGMGGWLSSTTSKQHISPAELGADYQKIANLAREVIRLNEETRQKWNRQQWEQKEKEIKRVLNNTKDCFFYRGIDEYDSHGCGDNASIFNGLENGQEFSLIVPENHPALANISHDMVGRGFYLIKGIENLSLETKPASGNQSSFKYKKVDLKNNNITITHYKNY